MDRKLILSPNDESVVGEVDWLTASELQMRLEPFFKKKVSQSVQRARALKMVAEKIQATSEDWARLIASEGGKPLRDARIEVMRAVVTLELCAEEAVSPREVALPMQRTAAAQGKTAIVCPEPLGPVLAITAFNHPLNLVAHTVGPAIAAGCPVFLKPAPETPLSGLKLIELLKAELPDDPIDVALFSNELAEDLAADPRWAGVTFIGSAKVGWHLRQVVSPGVRVFLEHGGSAPMIVMPSANIDQALAAAVKHAFYHSGQVCISLQRLFVHADIETEFRRKLIHEIERLRVGDARLEETDCGPLIRSRDLDRVQSWLAEAVASGARVLTGGERLGARLMRPALVDHVPVTAQLFQEEVFGPVLIMQPVVDLDEAIALSNSTRWSFQAAVFSQSEDEIERATRELRAAAVIVNEGPAFRVDWMPFRGAGPSGLGTGGVPYAVRDFTSEKLVVRA
ncbi:MAG: aldehyde dehydrogenase family protein [Bdellovibrionaceae bacterium]|nr:aldehyde dehydrogenase family protein [Pseudobdellovibrionaceae bacterium]